MEATEYKWHQLLSKIDRLGEFDFPLFREAYLETLAILRPLSVASAIPKEQLYLMVMAEEFASHFVTGISAEHDAAGELTAMMLSACCYHRSETPPTHWTAHSCDGCYSLDQVEETLAALAENYAEDYR